jgi:ATP-dependent Lon protease
VILPKRNEADLDDVPEDVRREMTFHVADSIDEVLRYALSENGPVETATGQNLPNRLPVVETVLP